MKLKNFLTGATALTLVLMPLAAEAATTIKPLTANSVKRAAPVKAESNLGGEGGGTLAAIAAAAAIILGIVLLSGGDDNPTSP